MSRRRTACSRKAGRKTARQGAGPISIPNDMNPLRHLAVRGAGTILRGWALLLGAIVLLKLIDIAGPDTFLNEHDRLLNQLTRRQTMLLAALLELGTAAYLWYGASVRGRVFVLGWCCCMLVTYKLGLLMSYEVRPCSCLGILGRTLALSRSELEAATWTMLAIMGLTSVILPLAGIRPRAREEDSRSLGEGAAVS